jgi:hypothetical protein
VSELDSSLDSLEFFQKNQAGRLDKSISLAKSRLGVSAAAGAPKDKVWAQYILRRGIRVVAG